MRSTYRLLISCPDKRGIVAKVSAFIAQHQGWIEESYHHSDPVTQRFNVRHEIRADSLNISIEQFKTLFTPLAKELALTWFIKDAAIKKRVALFVSKQSHCLADILYRWRSNELDMEIPCVVSNHEDLRSYVEWHGIPFHHVPIDKHNKSASYDFIKKKLDFYQIDTIVLARYMQIIPPSLCQQYKNQLINIHHSFLPSFIGAKPYHQAYDRGVKLIGATCHYVTEALDAGPIIEQDVVRVQHSHLPEDMVRLGKDVEKSVLARGLRYHLEDRIIVHQNKTIILQ